jgi:hypothetical protein
MPDDTTILPPDEAVTDPHMRLPANDDIERPLDAIPRGFAAFEFGKLLDQLQSICQRIEAVGMALARQLDSVEPE